MNHRHLFLSVGMMLALGACDDMTMISELEPPKSKQIMGRIISKDTEEFVIQDETATIEIEATDAIVQQLTIGETVRVFGNLDEDDLGEFDAYRIVRSDGTEFKLLEE